MKDTLVIFIPSLSDGGAEKVAVNLANSLAFKDKIITLLTLKKKNNIYHNISDKVELLELKSSRLLFSIFEIIKLLVSKKPKYFISFLYASCLVSVICKILSFSNVKIIFSIHNNFEKSKINLKAKITLFLFKYFVKFSYKIITVSKGLKKQLQVQFNIPKDKIFYIYNTIFKKKNINLLILGRLTKQKNQIFVIRNLRKLKYFNKIKLFLVGNGEDFELLKKEVMRNKLNNKVIFLGYKKNPYSLIRFCDYLIVPSLWEGFGNIVGEGLFFKKKIISSNCDFGPSEILQGEKFGYLYKINSKNDFIIKFMKSFVQIKLIPNKIYLNQFHISYVSKKYERVIF